MCKAKISYTVVIAIAALCGAAMFTGCGDDSNSSAPADEPVGGSSSSSVISVDSQTSSSGVQGTEPVGESSSSAGSSSVQSAEPTEILRVVQNPLASKRPNLPNSVTAVVWRRLRLGASKESITVARTAIQCTIKTLGHTTHAKAAVLSKSKCRLAAMIMRWSSSRKKAILG